MKKRDIFKQPKVYSYNDLNAGNPSKTYNGLPKVFKIILILILIIPGLGWIVLYSPFFKIENIIIKGTSYLEQKDFEKEIIGQNIFLLNTNQISENILNKYPEIESININRGLPKTIKITIIESQSKIVWQTFEKSYLVNNHGIIIKEIIGENDLPKIKDNKDLKVSLNDQVVSENCIDFTIGLNNNFKYEDISIDHFEINETIFQLDLITNKEWKVIFDTTGSFQTQLDDLERFLADYEDEIKEYADLRVENKVYYK